MNIPVKQYNDGIHMLYDMVDQKFYCTHEQAEIDTGEHFVYCPDCDNSDLTDEQANDMVINKIINQIDMIADYETAEYLERS